ncbi:MAG: DUF29 domain-containing protein [Leptolyngbya sp. IPPAS B-1204]|nr:DUF29 domain-containing protein [Elainella sp. C42_A2020_010]RNJ66053.1 MAG: DUF29 domain-containing protein [Leptolyngbya sp. IPPAS B-1204]
MTSIQASLQALYDQDFAAWIEATVACLKARDVSSLDWNHLIEEIEDLGKSQRRELKSRLGVLLIHLLKRCYVALPEDYRGWGNTIDEQRRELVLLLEQSPSLKRYLAAEFDEVWTYALRQVRKDYPAVEFPDDWPFSREVEALLTQEVWQN